MNTHIFLWSSYIHKFVLTGQYFNQTFILMQLLKYSWIVIGQCCNFHSINSTVEISWDIFFRMLADYHLRHLVNNVAIHMIASEWTYLYCIWKFHGINCPFHWCNFHGINSTFEISWDIFRILADYCLHHLVNDVAIYICPTHDYIRMEITVLYLKISQHHLSI